MSAFPEEREYDPNQSAVFLKTREKFGGLSNMSTAFPLHINNIYIRSSEALYQACRFPTLPDVQQRILDETSPMTAKMVAKPFNGASRPDWDSIKVSVMRWCLRAKLVQHPIAFGDLLLSTGNLPIVEKKSRRSDFWGARLNTAGNLIGPNVLGRLLMELRDEMRVKGGVPDELQPLLVRDFLLLGRQIETVRPSQHLEHTRMRHFI